MIPLLTDIGAPWKVLPPGVHDASLAEVESRFATNDHRKHLFAGLRAAIEALRLAGCRVIYLDGSFVTGKPNPADFDCCWEAAGVDLGELDPVLLDFSHRRRAQKAKYCGELFPADARASRQHIFVDFFQVDKYTGSPKGIIRLSL
jgi:hypothetical protein